MRQPFFRLQDEKHTGNYSPRVLRYEWQWQWQHNSTTATAAAQDELQGIENGES
jgi:hypothetical protein